MAIRYNETTRTIEEKLPGQTGWRVIKRNVSEVEAKRLNVDGHKAIALVESYKSLGLSEEQAQLAAGVERSITEKPVSLTRLAESFKALGMSDDQAKEAAAKVPR